MVYFNQRFADAEAWGSVHADYTCDNEKKKHSKLGLSPLIIIIDSLLYTVILKKTQNIFPSIWKLYYNSVTLCYILCLINEKLWVNSDTTFLPWVDNELSSEFMD